MKSNDREENKIRRCANCGCGIYTGDEVLTLQCAVIGVMRPIPLDEIRFFHSDTCFKEYVRNSHGPELPKRIP